MHYGRIERSPRLQRVREVLRDCRWHSTRQIMAEANVCAVNSCISELRANGFQIDCEHRMQDGHRLFYYRLTQGAKP